MILGLDGRRNPRAWWLLVFEAPMSDGHNTPSLHGATPLGTEAFASLSGGMQYSVNFIKTIYLFYKVHGRMQKKICQFFWVISKSLLCTHQKDSCELEALKLSHEMRVSGTAGSSPCTKAVTSFFTVMGYTRKKVLILETVRPGCGPRPSHPLTGPWPSSS